MTARRVTAEWVRDAHGDAWQELGRHRTAYGGGVARLPGIRLMASGLSHPQWNNGDVDDPRVVDLEAVRRWYGERGVPWGVHVAAGAAWPHGRRLFAKRLMGLVPDGFAPVPLPSGVTIRAAAPRDIDAVLLVDSVAFDGDADVERPWMGPLLAQPSAVVALAELDGEPVGTGYSVASDGTAGRSLYVAGIGVLPAARRRGIGGAVSAWLIDRGFAAGAELAHLHPDTEEAASVYRRLGFVEVDGLDVYVDN